MAIHNLKPRKPSNFKKKPKSNSLSLGKIVLYAFLVLLFIAFTVSIYQFRYGILQYIGYYSNSKTEKSNELAAIRIFEILQEHNENAVGIDVSEYQENIDWEEVGKVQDTFDLSFVFIRATAGRDKVDKKFKANWYKAKKHNFIRGAYHYYRPNENSIEQADNFIKIVSLQKGDFPPVLDIEKLPKTQSLARLKLGLQRWLDKVEAHYKVKPIIYSGESYYKDFLKEEFSDYTFWIANYNYWKTKPDDNWLIWQFSEDAKVSGIDTNVDINIYNGTKYDLISLVK